MNNAFPHSKTPSQSSNSRSSMLKFAEPADLVEAKTRICSLFGEIELIEAQMSDPNRTDPKGTRLTGSEYRSWKRNARYALAAKKSEYQYLKLWVQLRREALEEAFREKVKDGEAMILALVDVINRIFDSYPDVGVSASDQAVIDAARGLKPYRGDPTE